MTRPPVGRATGATAKFALCPRFMYQALSRVLHGRPKLERTDSVAPEAVDLERPDLEAGLAGDDKLQLRLWLRLLTCTALI